MMKAKNKHSTKNGIIIVASCILLSSMNAQGGTLTGYPTSTSNVSLNEVHSNWTVWAQTTSETLNNTTWRVGEFNGYIKCSIYSDNVTYISLISDSQVNGVKLNNCPTWLSFKIKIGQEAYVQPRSYVKEKLPSRDDFYTVEWGKITAHTYTGGGESSKMTNYGWYLESRLWVTVSNIKLRLNTTKTFKFQNDYKSQILYVYSPQYSSHKLYNKNVNLPVDGAG
ncbi:hypothetical protein G3151_004211, partial [Salmonella enterica subsp. enterica serovar Montevideo]|nr:hypothetical protein [Salmonella enterica subsp. enterica serovar Montevideo]